MGPDFADRRDLRRRSGDEALAERGELLGKDAPLHDFQAAPARQFD